MTVATDMEIDMTDPFVRASMAQTMMRDFNRLREAIRSHDSVKAEAAFDKCERWIDQLEVKTGCKE